MALMRLVYVSIATINYDQEKLTRHLERSRDFNFSLGVTGMLLYRHGDFMQLLEGEEEDVRRVFQRITRDGGHRNILVLLEEPCEECLFADWSMGFHAIDVAEMASVPGFSNFLQNPLRDERLAHSPHECLNLLCMFESMF